MCKALGEVKEATAEGNNTNTLNFVDGRCFGQTCLYLYWLTLVSPGVLFPKDEAQVRGNMAV